MNRSIPALGLCFLSLGLACTSSSTSNDPPPAPGFSISVNPGSLALQRGTSGSIPITVAAKNGFAGQVTFSLVGQPAGAEATFLPATPSAAGSVQISTAWSTAAGTYPVTIKGTSPGLPDATASIALQVTEPAPVALVWTPIEQYHQSVWLAFQDGDGPWTVMNGGDGSWPLTVREGRGGVAWASTPITGGTTPMLHVVYGSAAELAAQGAATGEGFTAVRGVLKSYPPAGSNQTVSIGTGSSSIISSSNANYWQVEGVRRSPYLDFLATLPLATPVAVFRPAITLPQWPAPLAPELDFDGAEAFPLQVQSISVGGDLSNVQQGSLSCYLATPGLTRGLVWSKGTTGTPAAFPVSFFAFPASKIPAGGLQKLVASATSGGSAGATRTAAIYFAAPGDKGLQLPAMPVWPTFEMLSGAAYARPKFTGAFQDPYGQLFEGTVMQETPNGQQYHYLKLSRAYLAGGKSIQVALPDFTGLQGWNPAWGPKPGTRANWTVQFSGGSGAPIPAAGDTAYSAFVSGFLQPQ